MQAVQWVTANSSLGTWARSGPSGWARLTCGQFPSGDLLRAWATCAETASEPARPHPLWVMLPTPVPGRVHGLAQ